MKRRHPAHDLPRLWLMTDERQGEGVMRAIGRLPRGAGVIFRHHVTAESERRALFERIRRLCRKRGLTLLLANGEGQAKRWRADGAHHRRPGPARTGTASAHNVKEIRAAERSGAALILLSPVHATRSHPVARALGAMRFASLLKTTRTPVIALGGMDRRRAGRTNALGAYGWAAIDAWS